MLFNNTLPNAQLDGSKGKLNAFNFETKDDQPLNAVDENNNTQDYIDFGKQYCEKLKQQHKEDYSWKRQSRLFKKTDKTTKRINKTHASKTNELSSQIEILQNVLTKANEKSSIKENETRQLAQYNESLNEQINENENLNRALIANLCVASEQCSLEVGKKSMLVTDLCF